jgi:hypothetical protein
MAALEGWHTLESIREQWIDAPEEDDQLQTLLDVAAAQCLAYGPELEEGQAIPTSYQLAQLMQTQNLWNSSKQDNDGEIGGEGFGSRVFPMDWAVKNILRPKLGVPVMF